MRHITDKHRTTVSLSKWCTAEWNQIHFTAAIIIVFMYFLKYSFIFFFLHFIDRIYLYTEVLHSKNKLI